MYIAQIDDDPIVQNGKIVTLRHRNKDYRLCAKNNKGVWLFEGFDGENLSKVAYQMCVNTEKLDNFLLKESVKFENFKIPLAIKFKNLRNRYHLTIDEMSKLVNVSPAVLRHWEQGAASPPLYVFDLMKFYLKYKDIVESIEFKDKFPEYSKE